MGQQEMADLCGVTMRSQRNYEKGERQPDALYLSAMAAAQMDVLYVLTGQRQVVTGGGSLNKREEALLDNYRHSGEEGKKAVEATATALARKEGEPKKSRGGK